jgi:hypothetical protein
MATTDLISKNKKRQSSPMQVITAVALLSMSYLSFAQGLDLGGEILLGVSRTDNIFLLPDDGAVDETVSQVRPLLSIDYMSNRIEFTGRYQFDYYKYKDLGSDNKVHQYDISMTNELIEDSFFFDLGGARTQAIIDPDAIVPPGNLPISNNLVDRDDYYLSPRIDKTFRNSLAVLAEYRYEDVKYDDSDTDNVLDSVNETANVRIDNYDREQGLTFATGYEWEKSEYDRASELPWEYNKAFGELGYWIGDSFRIFGGGGKESAWDDPVDRSLQDDFWEAGFALAGSGRVRAEFAVGERSFGSSWRGDIEVRLKRGDLQFSYQQLPTTIGRDQFSTGLLDPNDPGDLLSRPGSAERYISNRGEIRLSLELRRSNLDIIVFDEDRTGRYLADGTPLPDEAQLGATMTFNLQAGGRTEFVSEVAFYNRSTESAGEVDYLYGSFGVNYRLRSRLTLSGLYIYGGQSPAQGSTVDNYDANTISLFLSYTFLN